MKQKITTAQITKMALMIAFVSVSSYILIPLPFAAVSITGQTLVINLIAMVLSPKEAAVTTSCYWILGFVGAPIFSGGSSGPAKMLGPQGGYCVGFIVATVLISLLRGKKYNPVRYTLVAVFVGMTIIYGFAVLWLAVVTDMTLSECFMVGALPFIPLDIVKCIIASLLALPVQKAFYALEGNGGRMKKQKIDKN